MDDGYVDELEEQVDDSRPEERDLAEDAQWKQIQKNTFTRWSNQHLKSQGLVINDLQYDLSDGLKLVGLISVLASQPFKHVNKHPTFRTQKLENVTMVLKFLEESEQMRLVNIDSSDIVDCRLKLILGLIWTLILHYSISMPLWEGEEPIAKDAKGKGPSPKQRVLSWLNSKMPDKPVKNLTNDWNSGIAIGALVDALAPGLCPDWSDWNPKDALKNAKEAMDLAEKWLDVAQLLKPEEMVDPRIDEKALMTYLSQFPQAKLKEGAPLRPRTNPARVRAYGPGLERVGNAVKAPARFTVDAFSAGFGKLEVVVLNPKGANESVSVDPKPNQNQIYACCYTPTMQGEYRVIIKYAGKEIPNSPYNVTVEASAGDPTKVTASGPGIERTGNVIGKRTFFNVFLNGAGVGNIEAKIRDPQMRDEIVKPLITKQNDTTFLVEYSPIVAGPHSVEVLFAGQPIPLSPFPVEVGGAPPPGKQAPLVAAKKAHPLESHPIMQGNGVRPGGAAPANQESTASIAPKKATPGVAYVTGRGIEPKGLRVNEPTDFTVHTENAGVAKLQVKIVGPGGVNETVKIVAQDPHSHLCQYKPTRVGQYVIVVEYGGPGKVQKSPFKVDVAGACKSKVVAYGPGLKGGVVNTPAPFTVESHGSPGELGFAIEGPSQAQLTCNDNGDGSAAVQYVPTAPGEYAVHVLCNKEDIQGSPFMAQIQDVPKGKFDVAKVKASGPGLEPTGVQVGKETSFTIETKDAGELLAIRTWCIDLQGKEVPIKVVEKAGTRSYTCTYTATTVGKHTVYISYGGYQIKDSPYKVTVSTEASGAQVTASGPGLESATIGKPAVFSIDTKRVGGDTGPITVEITTEDKKKIPFQSRDKDGVREIQYVATGTTETRYTITVSYRGKPVGSSPFIVPVHVTSAAKGVARASGRGIQPRGIRVNEDVFFNVHTENCPPNGAVKAKLIGPGGVQQQVTITKVTETLYKCQYRATKVGNYVITVEYAGTAVTNSPFKVAIDAAKQSKIRAYGPGLESAVVGVPAKFTVDSNGDRSQLTFVVNGPGPAKVESRDNGDGTVSVQYHPTKAGEHAVLITAGTDDHIPGSPFMVLASEQSTLNVDVTKVKVSGPGIEPNGNTSGKLTSFTIDTRPLKQKVPVEVKIFSKDGAVVPVQLLESTDGTHKCSYTPLLPQPHLVYVSCTGIDLPNSPYKVNIGQGKASGVKVSGPGLEKAFSGQQTFFTIDTTEVGSDTTPISVDIKLSKGQQVPFSSKVVRPGVCEISYTVASKTNDSLTITINYESEQLKDSPYKVPVDATTPEPAKVTVTGRGVIPKGVRANETVTFKVHTDRPSPSDVLKTKVIGPNGIPVTVDTKKLSPETYECQYTSPREGGHVVTVDFNGKPADKSPFKVHIDRQKTSKIKAFGPGLEEGVAGVPAVFTVNPNGETSKIDFKIQGPKEAKITCQDNGDGTIGVQYLPLEKGEYAVHVMANGDDIPLSPFMVDIAPAPDKNSSVDNVKAHGPGLEPTGVVAGKPTQFTVDATRAPTVKPVVVKCYDAEGTLVTVTSSVTGTKISSHQYTPTKPGKYTVSVTYGGVQVPKSPFVVNVGVEEDKAVLAYGPGLESAEVNTPTSFTVDATSQNGSSAKIQHSIVDDKNRKIPTKVTELAPGKQEISYTPSASAGSNIKVNVSYEGKPVKGSPFTIPVVPKKDKHVTATGRGIQPVGLRVNEEVSFNVESDSPIAAKDLKPKLVGPGGAVEPVSVTQVTPNKLQCTYVPTKVANYSIVAEMEGKPIEKSPFKVQISPKTQSLVKAFGSGLESGQAKTPATFFVETNGETGNLNFAVEGPSQATLTCSDEGNGRVKVEYVPDAPGEYAVRVLCNESDIKDSPFMVPISPAKPTTADLNKAKVVGPGVESKELPTDKETYFTVDTKNCGPVSPAVAKCYDKQGNVVPVKATKQPNGLEKFTYVPKKDGEHVVQVLVDDKEIPKSPFKVGVERSTVEQVPHAAAGVLAYGPGLKSVEPDSEKPVNFYVDLRVAEDAPAAVPVLEVLDDKKHPVPSALKSTSMPGLFEATFEPSASPNSECFHPRVTVDSEDIPGSPFSVPVKSRLEDSPKPGVVENLERTVQVGKPQSFDVRVKDGVKEQPTVTVTADTGAPEVPTRVKKVSPNLFQVDYTPTTPGQCVVTATCQDKPIEGTPVSVSVVERPLPVDDIVVEGVAPIAELDKPQSFTVQTPASALTPELVDVKVIAPSAKQVPVTKQPVPEGTQVTFVPEEEGPHVLGCWVQDQPVGETPCIVQAAPQESIPALVRSEPVPATLSVREDKPQLDKPCSFVVQLDETSPVANVEDIAVKVLAPDRRTIVPVETKQLPGGLACSFLPEHPGSYSLCATVNNRPIEGSPVTVVVPDEEGPITEQLVKPAQLASLNQPIRPHNALEEAIEEMKQAAVESSKWPQSTPTHPSAKVRIYGEGLTDVCATQKARFTIDSKEAPSAPIGVTVEGPGEAVITCVDNGDGTCGVEYEAPVPGLYTLNVLYDNVHIPQSPVVIPVYPQAGKHIDLSAITATGPGLNPQGVFKDCFARFTVDTSRVDSEGVGVVKTTVQSPTGKKTVGVVENLKNGKHLVRYTPTEEGPHKISVTYEGLPIGTGPFLVPVRPGFDAKLVTASGPGLHTGRVDEKSSFIIDLDGAGPGSLGLSVEGPADTDIKCHDNGDGTCLVEYTPTHAGDYELSVRFNDDDIAESPFRVRVLAPVTPANVKCAGPKPLSKLGRPNHFPVDCTEAGVAPLVATVSQPQSGQPEKPATVKQLEWAAPGTFDVCFEPDALGPCTVRVNYGNQPVPGSPFLTDVVPPVETEKVRVLGDGIEPKNGTTPASMPAVFHVDTKDAGPDADVSVGVVNPNGEPIPLRIEARPDGLFTCEYRTHDVGDHKISVDVDGKPVPKSPYTVKVVPTGDADKCTVAGGAEKVVMVDKESVIKVETKDAGDGQITCTVKRIERRQAGQLEQIKVLDSVSVEVQQHPDGITSVRYVPKEEGEYLVEVKFGGRTVPGGKFVQKATRVVFEQHTESVTRTTRSNVAAASPVATSAFHGVDFEIHSKDGLPLPTDLTAEVVQPSGNLETVPILPGGDKDGHDIKVAYQPSERGVHQLQINNHGRPIKGSPFQFFVDTKGEGRVTAYGPGLSSGSTNERAEFTVITKDAGPGGLSLIVEGPSKTEIKCEDNRDGTFAVSYVPRAPGDYSIIIKFKDQPIAGSPFIAKITGEPVQKSQVALGNSSEIPLRIPMADVANLTAELTTPSGKKSPCIIKKIDNDALGVSFTPKEVGDHLVSVFEKGVDIAGSPFTVTVKNEEVGDASKVVLSGPGLETGLANQINEFTIDTRQAGYGSLNISIEGPSKAEIDCKDNENGTCTVTYLPTEPGNYVINVLYAGKDVPGSPFTVPVRGDKSVASETQKMEHVQAAARTTTVGGTCEISLKINDQMALKDLKASVHTPSGFSEPCAIEDAGNGNIRLKFVAREVGLHRVTVLHRDRHIPGSPFQFTVGAAPLGGPNTVTASGPGLERGVVVAPNQFSIYTREAGAGNISVVMEGPSKAELQFQESEDKGSCEVTYRVALPGDYVCSIKFNGEHIVGSPFHIRVTADEDSIKPIVAQKVASSFSDIREEHTEIGRLISITVRPEDGEAAKLEASVQTPSGTMEPAIVQQIGDGQYGVKFTPRESGVHMVFVENHGRPVTGSPFRIPVGDYRADPGMVHASGDGLKHALVDKKAHFFVNTTNAGSGSLNVAIDGPSKVKMNCHETEEGYEFTYVATAAGSYLISITYGGNFHIVGSPFLAQVEGTGLAQDQSAQEQHSQVEIDAADKKCVSQYSERPTSRPDKVVCQGLGLKQAKLNSVNSFFVDASQAGYDILLVGIGGPVRPCEEVVVKHVGNNQFTVDYVIKETGNHIIMVRWGDRDVPGSPFMVRVD